MLKKLSPWQLYDSGTWVNLASLTEYPMDFGLREWLLILGPVIVVGVLLHGYWRMRVNRNRIKMRLDKSFVSTLADSETGDDISMLRAELPNGGARVLTKPEQQQLNLTEDVPVLMDPVDMDDDFPPIPARSTTDHSPGQKPNSNTQQDSGPRPSQDETVRISPERAAALANEVLSESDEREVARTTGQDNIEHDPDVLAQGVPEKFVVIYVICGTEKFPGQQLLESLVSAELSFGEMNIFHRMGQGSYTLFSLANAVEPGSFDLKTMADDEIPGVTLFMRVHELADPVAVFDDMISVAQHLASEMDGYIKDDHRSDMTQQTIAHIRQGIQDWQFKYR